MTASTLRLGIVGCGKVAEECHIPAAVEASHVHLAAVADSSPDRLQAVSSSFGLSCLASTSHADLFGRVDAVLLALPNHLHCPVALEFLNNGIHVLCEKPLATTVRDATRLCELAEERQLVLAVGYMKRFEPNCDLMKGLIEQRFLGRLTHFEFEFGAPGDWAPLSGYNMRRELAGGGVLVTNGCHIIDRMLYWFGFPIGINFSDDSHGGVEANCGAVFTFDSGLVGEVRLSKTKTLRNRFRVWGERGCIEIRGAQRESVTFLPADQCELRHEIFERDRLETVRETEYFRLQIEDFARAIQSGTPPRVTGRQGLASVDVIERCYRARTPLYESWASYSPPTPSSKPEYSLDLAREDRTGSGCRRPERKRSVLITGSTGFVGSRLCEALFLSTDYDLRPLVHSSAKASYIARYPLAFMAADLNDLASVRRAVEGCSTVVHLARGSDRVMIDGLKNVLRAAAEARVTRFVHVSSVAVYGNNPPAAARSETAPAYPTDSAYGNIKLKQEQLVASYGRRLGLPFVILRPPHIYGPHAHFVIDVIERLTAGTLPVVDGGTNVCNLVYVDNLVEAIVRSMEITAAVGETFFVTDKQCPTWRQCLERFGAMLGIEVPSATLEQLDCPSTSSRESLRRLSRLLLSREVRAALMALPPVHAVGSALYSRYEALPAKHQRYLRSWLKPSSIILPRHAGPPRYNGTDNLIAAQRRTVVHACDKAERLLGYTAAVGYEQAMALTRDWLQLGTTGATDVRVQSQIRTA